MTTQTTPHAPNFGSFICFIVGLLCLVKIKLVGDLYISELLLASVAVINIASKNNAYHHSIKLLLWFLSIWLIGQVISDIVNETVLTDRLRGQVRIVFLGLDILGLYFLTRYNFDRLFVFIFGLACGNLLAFIFFPSEFAVDYPWKFGLAVPTFMLTVLAAVFLFKRNRLLSCGLFIIFGLISILLAGRSIGGLSIITGVMIWFLSSCYNRGKGQNPNNLAIFSLVLLFTIILIQYSYGHLAENGYLGEVSRWKYLLQSSSEFGILVSGRFDVVVAWQAIQDSPIFGHGSWARDWKYIEFFQSMRELMYGDSVSHVQDDDLIPSHSHLFGAWVEAGILGAVFWLYVIAMISKSFIVVYSRVTLLLPLVVWALVMLSWDLLFSPLGAYQRLLSGFYIIVILYAQDPGFYRKFST